MRACSIIQVIEIACDQLADWEPSFEGTGHSAIFEKLGSHDDGGAPSRAARPFMQQGLTDWRDQLFIRSHPLDSLLEPTIFLVYDPLRDLIGQNIVVALDCME